MDQHGRGNNCGNTEPVVKRLLQAVWRLTSPEGSAAVLGAIGEGLHELGIGFDHGLVYAIEKQKTTVVVRCHELSESGRWRMVRQKRERDDLARSWVKGEGFRMQSRGGKDVWATREAFHDDQHILMRSLLEVPFSHGVLGVYRDLPDAFQVEDAACLEQLALVLSTLFHRLADLENLSAKERQLRQAQKLQLVGQLAAEMVHEINNPLTVVLGECDLLQNSVLDPEFQEAIQAISKSAVQAKAISNRIKEFVNGNQAEKGWLNFNRIVLETLELVRRILKKNGIELREELAGDLPWIEAHAGQIQQVLLNLIQNSWDALTGNRLRGIIKVRTYIRDRYVVLEVEDNGPGVAREIQSRIFEPFFSTKVHGQGTGLGLSVCVGIAEEHGGELRLEPRSLGACMVLQLPLQRQYKMVAN